MSVEELIIYGKKFLHTLEAKMLLANLLGYDTLELLNHLDEKVEDEKIKKYKDAIEKVIKKEPIQYVIGNVNFFGNEFDVNENVLIPRFETEELVDRVINFIEKNFYDARNLIDLGCGSGVIGITIAKKFPYLEVTCLDISDKALETTKKNAVKLNVNINVIKGDMLDNVDSKFDIIVSNPPYIKENEEIEDIVKNNEPHLALYGGVDGLFYYKKILKRAKEVVNDKFLIAFEIGYTQRDDIILIAREYFKYETIETFKDMSGKDRIIFIYNV